jgi:thymidylate kinase
MDREVLRRRQLRDGMAVPADGDAFWLLLLHCLLDKRAVAPEYRATLKELAARASRSPIARMFLSAAGDRWSPSVFTDAVLSARWQALEEMGARLAADLNRRRPTRDKARALAERALATARKPLLLARRRGVSVALLGPNGVGTSTAAEALQRAFPFEARVAYMGIWKEPGGGAVRARLEIVARPLRIWGRYLAAVYHQLRGCLVIFDRYVHEAWLPAKPPALALKKPYYWLLRHAIPPADLAVVLDVPGHVAYARKRENPPHELEWERRIYRELAGRLPSLEVVDASRDRDAVRADIMALVWLSVTRRWEGDRSRGKFAAAFGPSISSTTADRS